MKKSFIFLLNLFFDYQGRINQTIVESVAKEGKINASKSQLGRLTRKKAGDDWYPQTIEYCELIDYVRKLRLSDPEGIYLLFVKRLSYYIKGAHPNAVECVRFVCYPSAHLKFWEHSRRIGILDAAHLTARHKGSYQALATKDANNQPFTVGYEQLTAETKIGYDQFFDLASSILVMDAVVTDKFSGLKSRIALSNAAATAEFTTDALKHPLGLDISQISALRRAEAKADYRRSVA